MKLFKRIDSYFLSDEETGETAPISDYFLFYGFNGGLLLLSIFMLIKVLF